MVRRAPFYISLIIIIVSSLVVTTLLARTSVAGYVMYINAFLAFTLGPAIYIRLKKVVDLYYRPEPNPYNFRD